LHPRSVLGHCRRSLDSNVRHLSHLPRVRLGSAESLASILSVESRRCLG
jgi:hypothetical protein